MNFEITQEIDLEVEVKSPVIIKVSKLLQSFLADKNYGNEVQNLFIGCICVKPRPGYEHWFKIRKPKYQSVEEIPLFDGSKKKLKGVFSYDIKLDFEKFMQCTQDQAPIILGIELLKSLTHIDTLPKKVKEFDKELFKQEVEFFLRKEKLV